MTVTIRAVREADAPAVQAIYAPIVAETAISFEVDVPDVVEMAKQIKGTSAHYPYLVAEEENGAVAGYAYGALHKTRAAYSTTVETTVYVSQHWRRRGIGQALYDALLPELGARGYHRAVAGITLPNTGSVGLHEAMGFYKIGVFSEVGQKLGRYHDVGWWERPLSPA